MLDKFGPGSGCYPPHPNNYFSYLKPCFPPNQFQECYPMGNPCMGSTPQYFKPQMGCGGGNMYQSGWEGQAVVAGAGFGGGGGGWEGEWSRSGHVVDEARFNRVNSPVPVSCEAVLQYERENADSNRSGHRFDDGYNFQRGGCGYNMQCGDYGQNDQWQSKGLN